MKNYYLFICALIIEISFAQDKFSDASLWLSQDSKLKIDSSSNHYFNFNSIFNYSEADGLNYKNLRASSYSLFAVFKSDFVSEVELIQIKSKREKVSISNKQLLNSDTIGYKKVNPQKGLLLSYMNNTPHKNIKTRDLILLNLSNKNDEEGNRTDLLELLFIPRKLTILERRKIESFLSIKYGISLVGEIDYINSDGKKIWDVASHKSFNYRVTGIGRDNYFNLNQKQSGNVSEAGLYIGMDSIYDSNCENKFEMPNSYFFLWGDNNGSLAFLPPTKDFSSLKKMKRIWQTQHSNVDSTMQLITQVVLDKKAFSIEETNDPQKDLVWLVIDRKRDSVFDYQNADYYKPSREVDGRLYFDNIIWDTDYNGSDSFTFVKAPDFFVNYNIVSNECDNKELSEIAIKIKGGQPPYRVHLSSGASQQVFTINQNSHVLTQLIPRQYVVSVNDQLQRRQIDSLFINSIKNVQVSLASEWFLGDLKQVVIIPEIINTDLQKLFFTWKLEDTVISTTESYIATKVGKYSLLITNEEGCQSEHFFAVLESQDTFLDNWIVFPNPIVRDYPFNIKFSLEKEARVTYSIYDMAGKLIEKYDLGILKDYTYSKSLSTVGTYLIVVTVDGVSKSTRLIVN